MDLIERQKAIDADALIDRIKNPYEQAQVARWVNEQPTIEPEKRTEKRTETHACDLIDREAAVDAIYHHLPSVSRTRARTMLHEVPSAQPERKTGKWNFIGDNMFECTSCGVVYTTSQLNGLRNYDTDPYAPKFCPNCGADMRGEQND